MESNSRRLKEVIVLPYPIQGHINPMLQFSKQLASRGLNVTLATTYAYSSKFMDLPLSSAITTVETIDDGSNGEAANPGNVEAYIERFDVVGPKSLAQLIEKRIIGSYDEHSNNNNSDDINYVTCVIYDSCLPWALGVAKKYGLFGASFFTQSCLVSEIFYRVHEGILSAPTKEPLCVVDGLPIIEVNDLPSFVREVGLFPALEKLVFNQFSNVKDADWRFFNTFDALENKVVNWMTSHWPVKTIGPCIPSMYLDKRLPDDKEYGLSLFQPQTDACIQWLDAREIGSVVYISMGSLASLGTEQMQEIAKALENCNKYFLWVVRASEEDKLPLSFKEKTSNRGLIVNWCPQLEVLAHHALGCFVTHCGWNSTLEAISLGVPMVTFPQWTDQPTNAKCIVDFWKIGVRVRVDEKGFLASHELEVCIGDVMEGNRAKEIKSNATKWKQRAKEAMENGGSSDRNFEEFVAKLI